MKIPQEVIDSRILTAYLNTDPELVISVENYNRKMENARKLMRSKIMLERIFLLLNIVLLIAVGIIGIKTGGVFILNPRAEWLEYAALVLFVAAFFFFGVKKRNTIAVTAFSVPLIFMDLRCAAMIAVNVVLTVFHQKKLRDVRRREGYPYFTRIHIEKKNCNAPENTEKPDETQG